MQSVLIVDDLAENLYLLEVLLKGNDFNVFSAHNGAEALEIARKNPPDMVISDILMPVMDGYAFCREWRADERLRHIPFIFYTATFVGKKDEALALNLGADRFIIKPQEPEKLLEIIRAVFADFHSRPMLPGSLSLKNEGELLVDYNEALFRKLEKKMADLELANQELKRKNVEMEQFTYTVSHDLNSSLVTINTFLEYLKTDLASPDPVRLEQDLFYISSAADKMKQMLGELLEFSRIGKVEIKPVSVTLHELVAEAQIMLAGVIDKQKIVVRVGELNPMLYGVHLRLKDIWENLLENAVKYMGDQNAPQVEIGCQERAEGLFFFVRDNGIGIMPEYFEEIFGIFRKLDQNTPGTGLGLAIVKRIVELYDGKIWVESKGRGLGSCFWFTLPKALKEP